ncbi:MULTISPECIES: transporter [Novosphingobium]|uniref:transporter n=1 Tax=unclassified Novosphingobium TaxID=2644732 RepID=UPI000AE75440|nr:MULTISPECIES: transporter [unclassified Novosphingobium]TCM34381.1 magnesium transporter/zinc transporter [Novosphingobium sp. ST904]WRT96022.1 transporter [Novosphingobium sp. RL4]
MSHDLPRLLAATQGAGAPLADGGMGPGLIWGMDLTDEGAFPVADCERPPEGRFRWLHLNLAHQRTRSWIERFEAVPPAVRELLLSPDTHQRALVDGGTVACVLHDFERDFDVADTARVGGLRMALAPGLMLTARLHPIRSADIVRTRLSRCGAGFGAAQALELLAGAISENIADIARSLSADVQHVEDMFLDARDPPKARDLIGVRRRLAQIQRLLTGMRGVFQRLEKDEELPEALLPGVEKIAQRIQSLDGDVQGVQSQLRLLREELDIQEAQRTNQNLYILSIVTALMLPATLVTGIFGMNTGGLPFAQGPYGTIHATLFAGGAAIATYLLLRWMGFMRR